MPVAFSPRTGLLYIPAHNTCMDYEGIEANYIAGTPYLGADVKMYPGPGGYQGELVAWDPVQRASRYGASRTSEFPGLQRRARDRRRRRVLRHDGRLVQGGRRAQRRRAVEVQAGSGIVGNPMTYLGPDGKQYVAIYAGIGGWMGAVAFPTVSADDPYAALGVVGAMKDIKKYTGPGDVLYVFGF